MRAVIVGAILAALSLLPADRAHACSLALQTAGSLVLNAAGDTLASEPLPGTPATLTAVVPSLTSIAIDVSAATRVNAPGGYDPGGEVVQVAYQASVLGLVQLANQPYTTSPTGFASGVLGLGAFTVTIVMNNRIVNPNGFASGTYGTRTVVTCHP